MKMLAKCINLFTLLIFNGQVFSQDETVELYKGLQLKGRVKSVKQWIYEVLPENARPGSRRGTKNRTTDSYMGVIKGEELSDGFYYAHFNKKGLPDSITGLNEEERQYNFRLYEYDINGNITRIHGKEALTSISVKVDNRYSYQYDTAGNITEKIAFTYNIPVWHEKYRYIFFAGNGIKTLAIKRGYDKEKIVYTQYFNYDEYGRLLEYKKYLNDSLSYVKNCKYDVKGRLVFEKEHITGHYNPDKVVVYSYSTGTCRVKLTDKDGARLYAYDSSGRIVSYKLIYEYGYLIRDFSFTYETDENDNWVKRHWFDNLDLTRRFCTERKIEYYKQWELEKPGHCPMQ